MTGKIKKFYYLFLEKTDNLYCMVQYSQKKTIFHYKINQNVGDMIKYKNKSIKKKV